MPAATPDPWPWQLDGGGWRFLLPPRPLERVLCYDNLGGATFPFVARLAQETLVVHHDPGELARLEGLAEGADMRGVRFARIDGTREAEGLEAGFDAVLVHDPEARTLRRDSGPAPSLDALCARAFAVLRPRGLLYLGFRNRFSYRRVRASHGPTPRLLSLPTVTRAMRRAGLTPRPPQPFLLEGSRVSDLVAGSRYRSAKNPFLAVERARELLLRGWGSRHLAPAYGVLGFRGPVEASRLERLVADPWLQSLAPGSVLRRCVVLQGTQLMLSLGEPQARHGSVVLTVSDKPQLPERRRAEAEWLRRLAALPAEIAGVIPVFHGEQRIDGFAVSAQSERPGMTVDRDAPFLAELTAAAARWLRAFHRATARPVELDPACFERAFTSLFERARQRHRALSSEITALEAKLRSRVLGRLLPLGWLHGDFKLENVVFDERTRRLTGVIDWDLAAEAGPPLVDLLYLLLYNRVIRAGREVLAGCAATLLRREWTVEERALIDAHHDAIGGERSLETAHGAFFLAHHLGARATHDLTNRETRAELSELLAALTARLGAEAS
jgi:aminoglycoside phosphotransferase (APT) family kinase protein